MKVAIRIEAALQPAEIAAAVDRWLQARAPGPAALLYESGLPLAATWPWPPNIEVAALAAGCPCCTGGTVLRATLVRVLRQLKPASVLLLMAREEHAARLRSQVESAELGHGLRLI
jgi:hypothetical protein